MASAGAGPARKESDTTLETPVTASTTLAEESYPCPSQAVRSGLILLRPKSNTLRFDVHVEENDGASLLRSPRFGSALVVHSEYKMSCRREVPLSNNNNTC